jgi:hypothetical protein
MSTNVLESNDVTVLIDEENIRNKRVYINEQGNRGEVLCNLSIKNKTLIDWEILKLKRDQSYLEILNNHIPGKAFIVHNSIQRLDERLKSEISKTKAKLKRLNRKGTKQQREKFKNSWKKFAILNSDIVTAQQWQDKITTLERKNTDLEEVNCDLGNQVENWTRDYAKLEQSKKILFEEMVEEMESEIDKGKENSKKMNVEIKKLKRLDGRVTHKLTPLETVSNKQRKRRISEFSSNAQKALWFSEAFGFHLDTMLVTDDHANRYKIPLRETNAQVNVPAQIPVQEPSGCAKHYERLTTDEKAKVESLLFLVDKFGVSDKFVHEMSMVFQDLPRSYVVKECRLKINSNCVILTNSWQLPWGPGFVQRETGKQIKVDGMCFAIML